MDMSHQLDTQHPQMCYSSEQLQSEETPPRKMLKSRNISSRCYQIRGTYHLDTADVYFVFDVDELEVSVPAHKCMLAFHSPVFRQMLYGELKEKGDIKLNDTTVNAFVDFMKCMYDFELAIDGSQSKIEPLLKLAHKYDVNWLETELKRILTEIMVKNVDATMWVFPLADLYRYDELRQRCVNIINLHGRSIMESVEFVDCEIEMIREILRNIDFVGRDEARVFESCIKWAERACEKAGLDPESPENIREQLGDCFDLIRFDLMTAYQFTQCLSIKSEVFIMQEIRRYATEVTPPIYPQNDKRMNNDVPRMKQYEIRSPYRTMESSLQLLLEDKSTADVTFILKNDANEETDRISAHKCILASKSSVFEKMFRNKTKSNDEITITGVSNDVFMYFLRLMYAHFKNQFFAVLNGVSDQHINALLSLHKEYLLLQYNKWYTDYLSKELNEQNVLRRFELSHKYSLDEFKTKCVYLMKEKGEQIIKSEAFMDCSQENLKVILELGIWEGEKSMAAACIEWAKKYYKIDSADPEEIRQAMGDLFTLVPFAAMDPMEFIYLQSEYRGIFTANELEKLINNFGDRNKTTPTVSDDVIMIE